MKTLFVVVLGFAALFTGCTSMSDATVQRRQSMFRQVQLGMSKASLAETLGQPQKILADGRWHWESGARWMNNLTVLEVRFDEKDLVAGTYRRGGAPTSTASSFSRGLPSNWDDSPPKSNLNTQDVYVGTQRVGEVILPYSGPSWVRE